MTILIQDQINLLREQQASYEAETPVNTNKLNAIINRISELEYELKQHQAEQEERKQEIENKIEGEAITFNVPGVDFTDLPAELIKLIDKVVRADRRRIYNEEMEKLDKLTSDHKETLRAAEERELNLKFQTEELQKVIETSRSDNERLIRENGDLRDQITQVNAEKADIEQKLRNAAAQIDDQKREIDRLNSQVDDYQKEKVFGAKKATEIIDVTPEETSEMQDLVNSITKKYIDVKPIGGNWHELVAEDGTKEVVHTKDLPSLETQGSQFRDESNGSTEPSGNQLPSSQTAENVGVSFQKLPSPDVTAITPPKVHTGSAPGEMVVQRTIEERVKALEAKVAALELGKGAVA